MAKSTTPGDLGSPAPEFTLPGVDGRSWSLDDFRGPEGFLVMFICNHCPYVRAITTRLVADMAELLDLGVKVVAINANDAAAYPADSFPNMKRFAEERGFNFPYLHDETQEVAHAYGAVCTPDFFGYDGEGRLRYRGRLDAGRTDPVDRDALARELRDAMKLIAQTGRGPDEQHPSVGCSIKWKR